VEANITFTGDLTAIIHPGDILKIEGAAVDNGYVMVQNEPAYPARDTTAVAFAAGVTTIMLANGHELVAAGAVGTFKKIMSVQHHAIEYAPATVAIGPPGVLTFAGDLTDHFAVDDFIVMDWGTDTPPGKDGIYQIFTIAFATPTTTITLTNANVLEDGTVDGTFHKVDLRMKLTANETYLWAAARTAVNPIQPRGAVYSALQGDVSQATAYNEVTTAANFQARFPRNGVTP